MVSLKHEDSTKELLQFQKNSHLAEAEEGDSQDDQNLHRVDWMFTRRTLKGCVKRSSIYEDLFKDSELKQSSSVFTEVG